MIGWLAVGLALAGNGRDGDEISRSRGPRRGVVVLWPRVVPPTDDPVVRDLADRMQDRLYAAAAKVVPYRRVDVRPEPERVCPREGCRVPAVSVTIGHREGGCAIVGQLQPPGATAPIIWTIAGEVEQVEPLRFRDPPESALLVREFAPCRYAEATYEESVIVDGLRALVEGRDAASVLGLTPADAVPALPE